MYNKSVVGKIVLVDPAIDVFFDDLHKFLRKPVFIKRCQWLLV